MLKKINRHDLFFTAYIIFLFGVLINSTKYNFVPIALKISHVIQLIGCFIAIIKIILDVYEIYLRRKEARIDYKYLLFFVISVITIIISKSKTVAYFDIFVLASKDINFKRILKVTLYTLIGVFIYTVISYFCGLIVDVIVYRGEEARHSFGWTSPNQLMIVIFEIICIYLYLRKDKLKWFDFVIPLVVLGISYYFTESRMCLLATIILLILYALVRYTNIHKLFNKVKVLFYAVPIVLTCLILGLTIAYKYYDLTKVDQYLTGRLLFGSKAIDDYGIQPFGKEIVFTGQRAEGEQPELSYNYVDSSYLKILINYGPFILIGVLVFLILLTRYAFNKKDYYLLVTILVIELYCFMDSFLFCIEFNPFLLLLWNIIYPLKRKKTKIEIREIKSH